MIQDLISRGSTSKFGRELSEEEEIVRYLQDKEFSDRVISETCRDSALGLNSNRVDLILNNPEVLRDFIYVPSIELYVARERTHQRKNQHETHEVLSKEGSRMLTTSEFVEFLKYTKVNFPEVYEEVTGARSPRMAERLDAYFEQRGDGLYVLTGNKSKAERLDEDTLMEDGRISLESWISNPTLQGLPKSNVEGGKLSYWAPRDDCVARFGAEPGGAILFLNRDPFRGYADLGVRTAKPQE